MSSGRTSGRRRRRRRAGASWRRHWSCSCGTDTARRTFRAVQTIYFVFGNKRALLKELVDVTIAGDDEPVATMDRPWYTAALAADTAQDPLRAYVAGATAVQERIG